MKKIKILFLLSFMINIAWSQTLCGPNHKAGDTPPGCVLCSGIFESSTANFTAENFNFDSPCGKIENSQWISVRSNSEGDFSAEIKILPCFSGIGIDVMLYDKELSPVSDCISIFAPRGIEKINVKGLTPGDRYQLLIDGKDAAVCDFSIEVLTTASMDNPPGGAPIELTPDSRDFCIDEIKRFSIAPVENANFYTWQLPSNADVVAGGEPYDTYIDLRFSHRFSESKTVRITPEFSCFSGTASSANFYVYGLEQRPRRDLHVCPDDLPLQIDNIWVDSFGPFYDTLQSEISDCPEILSYYFRPQRIQSMDIDTVICPGACVFIGDSCYFEDSNQRFRMSCVEITGINIAHADTGYFDIRCFADTFINAIGFNWKDLKADSSDIFINDRYHETISHSSFLLKANLFAGDSVKFRVVPRSILGCPFKSSEITCALPKTSGIFEKAVEKNVKIFPNPASGSFEIQSKKQIDDLKIFDLSGKSQPIFFDKKIEVSHLSSGVYFLKIRIGEAVLIEKIVIF